MSDDYIDPDYMAGGGDDEIDYGGDYDNYNNPNEGGIDFDSMLYEAEDTMKHNLEEAIKKFKEIIELEKDNATESSKYSFKCYEKLSLIAIKKKNFDDFSDNFGKMFELYGKVDDVDKMDTIRNICNEVLLFIK